MAGTGCGVVDTAERRGEASAASSSGVYIKMVNDELVTTCKTLFYRNKDCLDSVETAQTFAFNICIGSILFSQLSSNVDTRGWGVRVELPQSEQETELKLSKP